MASSPILSTVIATVNDLKRTRRELEMLEDFLHQASLRTGGKAVKMPAISRQLDDIARDNELNLLKKADRERLAKFLDLLIQKAPVLHFMFASEPSSKAMNKLLVWLRANIHPQVVVSLGIQPAIAAGCVVRTANRQFDFSLRESLDNKADLLIKSIREAQKAAEAKPAGPPPSPDRPAEAATGAIKVVNDATMMEAGLKAAAGTADPAETAKEESPAEAKK